MDFSSNTHTNYWTYPIRIYRQKTNHRTNRRKYKYSKKIYSSKIRLIANFNHYKINTKYNCQLKYSILYSLKPSCSAEHKLFLHVIFIYKIKKILSKGEYLFCTTYGKPDSTKIYLQSAASWQILH